MIIVGLVLAAMPAQAQSYRQFSQWCFGQSTDAETIQGCDAVIRWARETPRDAAAAFYNRGMAYRSQGKLDRAIADYDEALKLKPAFADAWNERGVAHRQKGENMRAVADFDEAIRLKPDLIDAWFNRAGAWSSLGRFDRAIADLDHVLQLQPADAEALMARGEVRRAAGDVAGGDADVAAAKRLAAGRSAVVR
jgi:tetratricopeptide (TPR) repeat protein